MLIGRLCSTLMPNRRLFRSTASDQTALRQGAGRTGPSAQAGRTLARNGGPPAGAAFLPRRAHSAHEPLATAARVQWMPTPRHVFQRLERQIAPVRVSCKRRRPLSGHATFTAVLAGLAFTSIVSPGRNGCGTFFWALCAGFLHDLDLPIPAPRRHRRPAASSAPVRPRAPGRLR